MSKAIKKIAIFTGRVIKATGKVAAQAAAHHYASKQLDKLINECYQEDRVKAIRARSKLKRLYPDVYDVCDFSGE